MPKAAWSLALLAAALTQGADLPHFDEYPSSAEWHGPAAAVKLLTPSERMFTTKLSEAAREAPNFAGHYRIPSWGCGTFCAAGAVIDLQTGDVFPPPLALKGNGWQHWISCAASFEGAGGEFHVSSNLLIARCGHNFSPQGKNRPDAYYLLWEDNKFKELTHLHPPREKPENAP